MICSVKSIRKYEKQARNINENRKKEQDCEEKKNDGLYMTVDVDFGDEDVLTQKAYRSSRKTIYNIVLILHL